jgi:hypothetical protein
MTMTVRMAAGDVQAMAALLAVSGRCRKLRTRDVATERDRRATDAAVLRAPRGKPNVIARVAEDGGRFWASSSGR